MTKVLMFKPQFVDHVRSGRKLQTIRPPRKIPVHVGDRLSLRHWRDRPYASPQVTILEATCTRIAPVTVTRSVVMVDCRRLTGAEKTELALADGFATHYELTYFFEKTHGLPFRGVLIGWEAKP